MKCAVEMGSGIMIYIPRFKKIGSGCSSAVGIATVYRLDD
jgi:hypothetical protein